MKLNIKVNKYALKTGYINFILSNFTFSSSLFEKSIKSYISLYPKILLPTHSVKLHWRDERVNLHLVLGINMDTEKWMEYLERYEKGKVICVDYEMREEEEIRNGYTFTSVAYAKFLVESQNFKSVKFYKALYNYPIM